MLAEAANPGQMKIMLGDVLDYGLDDLFPDELRRDWDDGYPSLYFIGNLPFNISTVLLIRWLRQMYGRTGPFAYGRVRLTLAFQLEVARRITAPVLNYHRSRLSVMCQLFANVKIKKKIKGESFVPSPLVDTGVVKFVPLVKPLITGVPFDVIEKFVRLSFNTRNAFLSKSLKYLFPAKLQALTFELFEKANIDPSCTATMLDNEEYVRLIMVYWDYCQQHPELLHHDYRQVKNEPKAIKELFYTIGGTQRLIDAAVRREFYELPIISDPQTLSSSSKADQDKKPVSE
jgi:dimethyladenosine transferase 1